MTQAQERRADCEETGLPAKDEASCLLRRLNEIREKMQSQRCGQAEVSELESIRENSSRVISDPMLRTNIQATTLELEGRIREEEGRAEEAKAKYDEAAQDLVKSIDLLSDELLARSILLKLSTSRKQAKEAFKKQRRSIQDAAVRFQLSISLHQHFAQSKEISTALDLLQLAREQAELLKDHIEKTQAFLEVAAGLTKMGKKNKALEVAKSIPDLPTRAAALKVISTHLAENDKIQDARKVADTIPAPWSTYWKPKALQAIAAALAKGGKFDDALEVVSSIEHSKEKSVALLSIITRLAERNRMHLALEIANTVEDVEEKSLAMLEIAIQVAQREQIDQAIEIANSVADAGWRERSLGEVAATLAESGKIEKALEIANILEDPFERSLALAQVATQLTQTGRKEEALATMSQALEMANSITNRWVKSRKLSQIAVGLFNLGERDQAHTIFDQALEVADSIDGPELKSQALRGIATVAAKMGRIDQALEIANSLPDTLGKSFVLRPIAILLMERGEREKLSFLIELDLGSLSQVLLETQEKQIKIDLSQYSQETEESSLFLRGKTGYPPEVAKGLGLAFKNLWLARRLCIKADNSSQAQEAEKRLDRLSQLSPLDIRPLRESGGDMFVEREEISTLDATVAIRNSGSIAIAGERGSGKSTLVNRFLSERARGRNCLVVRVECPTYYESKEFLRFLLEKIIAEIKVSSRFEWMRWKGNARQVKKIKELRSIERLLKYTISREQGMMVGAGLKRGPAQASIEVSDRQIITSQPFSHPQIMDTIKAVLEEWSAEFDKTFIVIDELDKLGKSDADFDRLKYRLLQDLRGLFYLKGVYFLLIGLEEHFRFEGKDGPKPVEDSTFDAIISLKRTDDKTMSQILQTRVNWLHLDDLFDQSSRDKMVEMAQGSPRKLVRLLAQAVAYWLGKGIIRFTPEIVVELQ